MKEYFLVEKLLMNHFEWNDLTMKEKISELASYYWSMCRSKLTAKRRTEIAKKANKASQIRKKELRLVAKAGEITK